MGYRVTAALWLTAACCLGGGLQSGARKLTPDQIPSEDRFNFFDLELLQSMAQSQEGNVVMSPVSVKATLAMLLEGAGGVTAAQLRTALRLPEHQTGVQAVIHAYLTSLMEPNNGYKLDLANRVFMSRALMPNPTYVQTLREKYYADLERVDFTDQEKTARRINNWVNQLTRGVIPELVDAGSLHPDSQVLVGNAVYFKGKWKIPFEGSGTVKRCFYPVPDQCRQANMMEALGYYNYSYLSALDAYALELPYEGDKFSMVVVMPKLIDGITQLVRDIAHERMQNIVSSLATTEVLVSLPRFDIEFSQDLVPTLSALGVKDIFTPQSNLTGLFTGTEATAQVSNVFHKAKIIVNEEGSEAGAGTGALVIPLMGGSVIPKFRVDHPFLFFIRDMTTGVIVFAGRVVEPEPAAVTTNEEHVFGTAPPPLSTTHRRPRPRPTGSPVRPQHATQSPGYNSAANNNNNHNNNNNNNKNKEGTVTVSSFNSPPPMPKPQPRPQSPSSQNPSNTQQKPSYSQVVSPQQRPSDAQTYRPPPYMPTSTPPSPPPRESESSQKPASNYDVQYPPISNSPTNQQSMSTLHNTNQKAGQNSLLFAENDQTSSDFHRKQNIPKNGLPLSLNEQHIPNTHNTARRPVLSNQNSNSQYGNTQTAIRDSPHVNAQDTVRETQNSNKNSQYPGQDYQSPNRHSIVRGTQYPYANRQSSGGDPAYTFTQQEVREQTPYVPTRNTERDPQITGLQNTNRSPQATYTDTQQTSTRNTDRGNQYSNTQNTERRQQNDPYRPTDREQQYTIVRNTADTTYPVKVESMYVQSFPSLQASAPVYYSNAVVTIPTNTFLPANNDQYMTQEQSFQANGQQQYPPANESPHGVSGTRSGYQQPISNNDDAIIFANNRPDNARH